MPTQNKKVLFRIANLKQYFPLKKKGLFVRANDDISLEIYEGETFGLVGESGCGKSTLGRVMIQLYKQTDGKTMYYGRSLDDVAPRYVKQTLKTLDKRMANLSLSREKRDRVVAEFEAIEKREQSLSGKEKETLAPEKYAKMTEKNKAEKEAQDAFLDIAQIIGGFITVKDLQPVKEAFLAAYEVAQRRRKVMLQMQEVERRIAELGGDASQGGLGEKLAGCKKQLADVDKELGRAKEAIAALAKPYAQDEEFQRNEGYRDGGVDLARLTYDEMRHLRKDIQLIFQDPYSSLNARMTVGQIIGEGLMAHGIVRKNGPKMQEYVTRTMEDCGLAPYMIHRYPHQFSGGQRQRIGIARSLALKPRFVVCDEAVSALDVSIQSQIINLLQDLKEKENLTYMFISHDLSVVKYISDRIGVMYLGNIVELADKDAIFDAPRHPYTEALLSAIPTTDVDASKELIVLEGDIPSPIRPPSGCKFHTRCRYCTEICTIVPPQFEEVEPGHFVACHHKLTKEENA